MSRAVVGIDVGGTFTDLCLWDGRAFRRAKVPTTPDDYTRGVADGLAALVATSAGRKDHPGPAFLLTAGSTIATNTLLERRGARVALLATEGFQDLLTIGRQNRPELYALEVRKPRPLVAAEDCFGLRERVDAQGRVVLAVEPGEIDRVLAEVRSRGVESVAVCLLFSFLEPSHEIAVRERGRAMGLDVHCSNDLVPEFREFERASTTVINAYVAARSRGFLERLDRTARAAGASEVRVLQSNGGQLTAASAARQPVRTILSGPAGGAIAAGRLARRLGLERALTYDMGGTSTDVAWWEGQVAEATDAQVDGWPVRVPMLAIHTVGQGGGSIARIDEGGVLQVGPQSAAAEPGPACYGRGDEPTVTDAHVVLGRIRPEWFLGGRMALDVDRARAAMQRIADGLNCPVGSAAAAVVAVANAGMERALETVSARRGYDPAGAWLISFGGAGGLHAAALAESLDLAGVIVPVDAGIFSSTGMILADVVMDFSRSLPRRGIPAPGSARGSIDLPRLRGVFGELMDEAARAVIAQGFDLDDAVCERRADMRYVGQGYEITVPVESLTDERLLTAPFHAAHLRLHGIADPAAPVETVTARLRTTIAAPTVDPPRLDAAASGDPPRSTAEADVEFEAATVAPVCARETLRAGHAIDGPALIVESHATTLLPPGWRAGVEATGELRLTRT